jgi:hypothetical protein
MTARVGRWCISAAVGCSVVVAAARELNSPTPSLFTRAVLAPIPVVVALIPLHNIGKPEKPVYEGTPLHVLAAFAMLPICALAYTLLIYALLAVVGRPSYDVA